MKRQSSKNQVEAPAWFWWVPIGASGGPLGETDQPHLEDAVPAEPLPPGGVRIPVSKVGLIPELVDVIEQLAEQPIPAEVRRRLTNVLGRLIPVDEFTVD